jgi:hypothetical protein
MLGSRPGLRGPLVRFDTRTMPLLAVVAGIVAGVLVRLLEIADVVFRWLAGLRLVVVICSSWERVARSPRRWQLPVLALATSALLVVRAELSRLLAEMHVPGASSFDAGALARSPREASGREVIETWHGLGAALHRSAEVVYTIYAAVGLVLAPALATLVGVLLWKVRRALWATYDDDLIETIARRRLRRRGEETDADLSGERARVLGLLDVYRRLVWIALVGMVFVLALDVLEDTVGLAVTWVGPASETFASLHFVLWLVGAAKLVLLVLVALPGMAAAVSLALFRPQQVRSFVATAIVLRAQILLILVFAAGLFASDQSVDVLRRWREDGVDLVAGLAFTVLLGCLTLALGRSLVAVADRDRRPAPALRQLVLPAISLALAAWLGERFFELGEGLYVPAAILIVVGVLSYPIRNLMPDRRRPLTGGARRWLPAVLGAALPILLGLAVVRAQTPALVYEATGFGPLLIEASLMLVGASLLFVGLAIALSADAVAAFWEAKRGPLLVGTLAALAVIAMRIWLNPWRTSEVLGSIAVFSAFLVGALLATTGLTWLAERYQPPQVFSMLRLKRTPVFLLLLAWLLLAGIGDEQGTYYDVRKMPAGPAAATLDRKALTADALLEDWLGRAPPGEPVPLVFVAAAGGGIRAAFWTDVVLRCVLEGVGEEPACAEGPQPGEPQRMFVASGISGGSLGLAAYAAHLRQADDTDWTSRRLDDDYIAPAVGWALFTDLPLAFTRRGGGADRAEVLERAFERSWADDLDDQSVLDLLFSRGPESAPEGLGDGLYETWANQDERGELPLLMLNGTKVRDGCRFNSSVLDGAVDPGELPPSAALLRMAEDCLALRLFERRPDTEQKIYVPPSRRADLVLASSDDLTDFLCENEDVRLSTAVMLSARFPFVMPSGRITRCGAPADQAANVVDGGYFDTSAASPAVELIAELSTALERLNEAGRCIVPLFLQIDTGYEDPVRRSVPRPLESLVPLITLMSARNAREANARQAAALAFSGPLPGGLTATVDGEEIDRYAHVSPRAHPGAKAPLGWTLSRTAREDLIRQLQVNTGEIHKVRSWFSDNVECTRQA